MFRIITASLALVCFALACFALCAQLNAQETAIADAEHAASCVKKLSDPDWQVRSEAVTQLRLLSRRVERSGGQRTQNGEPFAPKVPGLLPFLLTATEDKSESVRATAAFALADTLDPEAANALHKMVHDADPHVCLVAACLLTEFHDATGIDELKKAVKRIQMQANTPEKTFERYMDGELVLASLARITGKDFGPIPMNPILHSHLDTKAAAEARYQELFETWVAWWNWTPK